MPDLPEELTRFTVTRTIHSNGNLSADVHFDAQVTLGTAVQADLPGDIVELLLQRVSARLVDGILVKGGTPGVELLSAAEVAIDGGFSYLATFENVEINGVAQRIGLRQLSFPASEDDAPFDLKDAAPIVSSTAAPTARGATGFTPWFELVPDTNPQLYQPMDPNGPVGDPILFEAIVDPAQIVSVVDGAVPSLVAAAIAEDGTVAAAAAVAAEAAVEADIAGRDLVQRTDPGIPTTVNITSAEYLSVVTGPNGELIRGDRTDGTVEIPSARIATGLTQVMNLEGLIWVSYLGPDGHLPELVLDPSGRVPDWVLADWKLRGNFGSGGSATAPIDIVIVAGQSNGTQRGSMSASIEPAQADVLEWDGMSSFVSAAGVPWLGSGFARRYAEVRARPEGRRVAIVKAALGSTGFSTLTPGTWDRTVVSGAAAYLYPEMIAKAQAALAAAPAGSRIVAVLWSQGEADRSIAATTYDDKLDDLITQTRIDLAIANLPFLISGVNPDWLTYLASIADARGVTMEAVLEDTPRRVLNTSFTKGRAGLGEVSSSGIHWQPLGQTLRGKEMAENGFAAALVNNATSEAQPPQNLRVTRSGGVATIEWDHPQSRVTAYTIITSVDSGTNWVTQTLSAATTHKHVMSVSAATPLWVRGAATNETGSSLTLEVHA